MFRLVLNAVSSHFFTAIPRLTPHSFSDPYVWLCSSRAFLYPYQLKHTGLPGFSGSLGKMFQKG